MAYGKRRRTDIAAALGVSPSVVDEISGGRSKLRGASWEELSVIAEECGVPFFWFWAEFDRLGEIAPEERGPPLFVDGLRRGSARRDPVGAALADAVAASAVLRRGRGRGSS